LRLVIVERVGRSCRVLLFNLINKGEGIGICLLIKDNNNTKMILLALSLLTRISFNFTLKH